MLKMMLILNPNSGNMKAKEKLFDIVNAFANCGYEVTVFPTRKRLDATEMVKTKSHEYDLVVCCGGDGTLNEVVTGLMETGARKPLGYLPAGTTNDFAASLHIPKDITGAIMNIVEGKPSEIDVGTFNKSHFIYSASFGMFTDVSYKTSQGFKSVFGHFAYVLNGVKSITEIANFRLKIECGGQILEGDFIFGAVLNSISMGGMIKVDAEKVDLSDGLFEVLLVRNPHNHMKLRNILIGLARQRYDEQFVEFFSTEKIKILSESDIPWCLDGEFGGLMKEAQITNQQKSISIVRKI